MNGTMLREAHTLAIFAAERLESVKRMPGVLCLSQVFHRLTWDPKSEHWTLTARERSHTFGCRQRIGSECSCGALDYSERVRARAGRLITEERALDFARSARVCRNPDFKNFRNPEEPEGL